MAVAVVAVDDVVVVAGAAVLFYFEWRLAALCLLVVPLVLIGQRLVGSRADAASYARQRAAGRATATAHEALAAQALVRAYDLRDRKIMRRFSAVLYHRKAGFRANAMGVWKVPEERIDEIGNMFAHYQAVSHCYQRPTYPDWPYSIFTMAHGRSKEECDAILDAIAEETGVEERATLYSSTEFKKIRLLYFTDDFKNWEAART